MTESNLSPGLLNHDKERFPIDLITITLQYEERINRRAIHQGNESMGGLKVDDNCSCNDILVGTLYNWLSKYAKLDVNETKHLKDPESENNKINKLPAE